MDPKPTKVPREDAQAQLLSGEEQARRDFLQKAGKFALITPPAVTTLLATSMNSSALANSAIGREPPGPGPGPGPKNNPPISDVTPQPPNSVTPPKPPSVVQRPKPPGRSVFDDLIAKCINLFS